MKKMPLTLVASTILAASPAFAQTAARTEQMRPARVWVQDNCPAGEQGVPAANEAGPLATAALSLATGLASDLFKSGLEAAATALEEASKEKAIGGQGQSFFNFYSLTAAGSLLELSPRLNADGAGCLIVAVDAAAGGPAVAGFEDLPENVRTQLATWKLEKLAVYVEAQLLSRGDSFVIVPNLIWYGQPLKGLPKGPVATELHATFAVPSAGEPGAGAFAVARIPLPALAPGKHYGRQQLLHYTSAALPLRPTTGAVDTRKQAVEGLVSSIAADEVLLVEERVNKEHAEEDSRARPGDAALKAKITTVQRLIESIERRKGRSEEKLRLLLPDSTQNLGSTSVVGRVAFILQPNKFGLALAQALKARAPAAATAVETALKAELDPAAWSATDTSYVQAMGSVRTAQQGYDAAMAGTDVATQKTALTTLQNAKAAANAAAATAGRPLPYPSLMYELTNP